MLETTQAFIFYASTPRNFWSDVVLTACYLINRMPSRVFNGTTLFSRLYSIECPFLYLLKFLGAYVTFEILDLPFLNYIIWYSSVLSSGILRIRKNIVIFSNFEEVYRYVLGCYLFLNRVPSTPTPPPTKDYVQKVYPYENFLLYLVPTQLSP